MNYLSQYLRFNKVRHSMVKSLEERSEKLLSRCEAMCLLCSKASSYWSIIKFCFQIPLVLTSSAMLIINSISENANEVKIPNIVVNAISVLLMSLNNSVKASEKCDLFHRLGKQFLVLSGQIENDIELTENDFNIIAVKYENLINECLFEEIPSRYKIQVGESYKDRHVPLQLNGIMGNNARRAVVAECKGDVVISGGQPVVLSTSNMDVISAGKPPVLSGSSMV
jgi:hypothetical protein